MDIINKIIDEASKNIKRIVLPEADDKRIIEASLICASKKIAKIILLGNIDDLKKYENDYISVIDPKKSELTEELISKFYELRRHKGISIEDAHKILNDDYMYYACMLVKCGYADGVVSGAIHSTANTLRPALEIIKTKEESKIVSSFMLINVPNCSYGSDGVFVFSDIGLNQNPTSEELAYIAKDAADSFKLLVGDDAYISFLSHSTYGSAKHDDVEKVQNALKIAKEMYPDYNIDGELQLDAAIDMNVYKTKTGLDKKTSANVLIFPDLDAGNIGYKLVERLAKAEAYGPITQGIKNPINDLSRGASVEDIVGVIAITSIQCK